MEPQIRQRASLRHKLKRGWISHFHPPISPGITQLRHGLGVSTQFKNEPKRSFRQEVSFPLKQAQSCQRQLGFDVFPTLGLHEERRMGGVFGSLLSCLFPLRNLNTPSVAILKPEFTQLLSPSPRSASLGNFASHRIPPASGCFEG
jgi:hypothetical protein